MAQVEFDRFGADAPGSGRLSEFGNSLKGMVSLGAAATSAALVVGLGFWGYDIAVRDVSGVPVVRALEGSMRVAPANPGGDVAAHQGLAVNVVAALGVAQAPAERLVLAPRARMLRDDDAAGLAPPLAPGTSAPVPDAGAATDGTLADAGADVMTDGAPSVVTAGSIVTGGEEPAARLAGSRVGDGARPVWLRPPVAAVASAVTDGQATPLIVGAESAEAFVATAEAGIDAGADVPDAIVGALPSPAVVVRSEEPSPDADQALPGAAAVLASTTRAGVVTPDGPGSDAVADLMGLAFPAAASSEPVSPITPISGPGDVMASDPVPLVIDPDAVNRAMAEALAEEAVPFAPLAGDEPVLAAAVAERSIRPQARPAGIVPVSMVVPIPAVQVDDAPEVVAETLPVGTHLVQIGAFDDAEGARGEWARLAGRFGDLMAGKARVVQAAQSGGRTFFRLRATGFDGGDDARRFCSALRAEGADCIPVELR